MDSQNGIFSKMQEIVAHSTKVNCVSLGQHSGRVMATGGFDKNVNLWTTDKPNCIMTLSGHTSTVECVQFNHTEELVAAGSTSGSLKIWNLEQCKIVRTLNGHKANLKCLEFHPCERFVLSGSSDSNIKLWDVERKGCVFTYRGHTASINCVKFSPDGRWFCSGSEDSTAKIYDITSGKQITNIPMSSPIINIEFHPNEFLLCISTADRVLTFWDIDVFKSVGSTLPSQSTSNYNVVKFHPSEKCIYAAANDSLKVFTWEPTDRLDSLLTGWGSVKDIAFCQDRIVAVSTMNSNVSTYIVDQNNLKPFGQSKDSARLDTCDKRRSYPKDELLDKKFIAKTPDVEDQELKEQEDDDANSKADIKNMDDYKKIFKPKNEKPVIRPPTHAGNPDISLNVKEFLPKKQVPLETPNLRPNEIRMTIMKGHNSMIGVLQARSTNLKIVRTMWTSGNFRSAIDTALGMKDQAVLVDIIDILNKKKSLWTIELSNLILPHIIQLLESKYENYALVGLHTVTIILKLFSKVIIENVKTVVDNSKIDINRDERRTKCNNCYTLLCKARNILESPQPPKNLVKQSKELKILKLAFKQLD